MFFKIFGNTINFFLTNLIIIIKQIKLGIPNVIIINSVIL